MNTKLTLSIDDSVIEKAKKFAKAEGRSLSDIIENYLKALIEEEKKDDTEHTPLVKSLKGSLKPPANFDYDYKKAIREEVGKKYL